MGQLFLNCRKEGERETRLEPATSSLGILAFIESKSLARFCCEFLNLQHLAESAFCNSVDPNEAQTRQVPSPTNIGPCRRLNVCASWVPRAPLGVDAASARRRSGLSIRWLNLSTSSEILVPINGNRPCSRSAYPKLRGRMGMRAMKEAVKDIVPFCSSVWVPTWLRTRLTTRPLLAAPALSLAYSRQRCGEG